VSATHGGATLSVDITISLVQTVQTPMKLDDRIVSEFWFGEEYFSEEKKSSRVRDAASSPFSSRLNHT
jgi:hypothetical protein